MTRAVSNTWIQVNIPLKVAHRSTATSNDDLLRPREVADMLGVSTRTIAQWARAGKLHPGVLTPGGHRRYRRADALSLLDAAIHDVDVARERMEEDAARLYEQGWSIRQVAERFECNYSVMRKILLKRTSLRDRGGAVS